jgi:hypothetical protein
METLRFFPPVFSIPKCIHTEQTISYRGQTVVIPAGSAVTPDVVSVQRNPLSLKLPRNCTSASVPDFQLSEVIQPIRGLPFLVKKSQFELIP